MSQHGSLGIRTALFRVFVLPNLSSPTARSATNGTRNVHFGSAEELQASIGRRRQQVQKVAIHPDIIEGDFFPTVSLVPKSTVSRSLEKNTPLPQLRAKLQQQNATKASTSEHEHLIMFKLPRYAPGEEPSPADLARLRAPESLIKSVKEAFQARGANPRMSMKIGGRLRFPVPVEEPLVKIMTGLELLKLRTQKERLERETTRREKAEKEVEITWTIKENDLVWSLNRIKQWLSEGTRVTVSLTRKRRWLAPSDEVCQALIAKIRESVAEVPDVKESNVSKLSKAEKEELKEAGETAAPSETLRGFGKAMTLSFVPKAKTSSITDAVNIPVPWKVGDPQLKQHLKAIGSALKRGQNVRIELSDADAGKVKNALDRDEVFQAIRSGCRQAKDVRIKTITGEMDEEDGTMVLEVMGGVSKGFLREIEVPANLSSKDAELRLKWIDEWVKQGLEVTVWVDPAGDASELETVLKTKIAHSIVKAGEADSHGQAKFMVEKDKTEVEPEVVAPVELPPARLIQAAWSPSTSRKPAAGQKSKASINASALLQSLERGRPPTTSTPRHAVSGSRPGVNSAFRNAAPSSPSAQNTQTRGRTPALGGNRPSSKPVSIEQAGIHDLIKSLRMRERVNSP